MTKLQTHTATLPSAWTRAASEALSQVPVPRPQLEEAKRVGREFWQAGGGGGDIEKAVEILKAWWSEENTYDGFWKDVLNVPDRAVKGFDLFHRTRTMPPWIEEVSP